MFALLFAKFGLDVSKSFIKWAIAVIALLAILFGIFLGYRHFENARAALIKSVHDAAVAQVEQELAQKSEQLVRQQQAIQAQALSQFSEKVEKSKSEIDELTDQIADIPDEAPTQAPEIVEQGPSSTATSSHPLKPPSPSGARNDPHRKKFALPSVNALDASLNRMLERASGR